MVLYCIWLNTLGPHSWVHCLGSGAISHVRDLAQHLEPWAWGLQAECVSTHQGLVTTMQLTTPACYNLCTFGSVATYNRCLIQTYLVRFICHNLLANMYIYIYIYIYVYICMYIHTKGPFCQTHVLTYVLQLIFYTLLADGWL